MANVLIEESTMHSIGNAIREETGKTEKILPANMPDELKSLRPYIKETYDKDGNLTHARMVGHDQVRNALFQDCYKLTTVDLPDTITSLSFNAFRSSILLDFDELPPKLTTIKSSAFSSCVKLSLKKLPETVTEIGSSAFDGCNSLALTELPPNLTGIGSYTFYNCQLLTLTEIPASVTSVGSNAFYSCTGLKTITFKGTPKEINATAFQNCSNLKTINVPWAEGKVANAPWGATNATINYNYTGE